ncbi:hypothetical protein L3i20_v237580 [Paenibacillus sp. L3-i20]|nr:peptidylprolyl isomerase [Paenibacillus sp. L3-i20]GKU79361.1 hypothetical protein L3i20_v237580 [Paenibacillus sp. L3-i20]
MKLYVKRYRATLFVMVIILLLAGCGSKDAIPASLDGQSKGAIKLMSWDKTPEMSIDLNKQYKANVETSKGSFVIELYANEAPVTVNNFVFLAQEGFYEGITFHSIIESFMIQTGDPTGNGTGNAGYRIPDELETDRDYEEGIVAMFNTGSPNSGSSQFFICTGPDAENLNRQPNYSIFGKVIAGMDTVRKISVTPVVNGVPSEQVTIVSISIEEK